MPVGIILVPFNYRHPVHGVARPGCSACHASTRLVGGELGATHVPSRGPQRGARDSGCWHVHGAGGRTQDTLAPHPKEENTTGVTTAPVSETTPSVREVHTYLADAAECGEASVLVLAAASMAVSGCGAVSAILHRFLLVWRESFASTSNSARLGGLRRET